MNKKIHGGIGAFFRGAFRSVALASLVALVGCGGANPPIGFTVRLGVVPETATMAVGRSQNIHASFVEGAPDKAPLSWKVREGDARGMIHVLHRDDNAFDATVTYTAPQTPGTYHVEATGTYGTSTKTGTAAIKVQ